MGVVILVFGWICFGITLFVGFVVGIQTISINEFFNIAYYSLWAFIPIVIGNSIEIRNNFCRHRNNAQETFSDIGRYKVQERNLYAKIEKILENFLNHESQLFKMIKERNTESLLALFEKYPDLETNKEIMNLVNKLIDLQKSITQQELIYNQKVNWLCEYCDTFPTCLFKPKNVNRLDYISYSE
jgi:hypothetical protein